MGCLEIQNVSLAPCATVVNTVHLVAILPEPQVRIQREARKWTSGAVRKRLFLMPESISFALPEKEFDS